MKKVLLILLLFASCLYGQSGRFGSATVDDFTYVADSTGGAVLRGSNAWLDGQLIIFGTAANGFQLYRSGTLIGRLSTGSSRLSFNSGSSKDISLLDVADTPGIIVKSGGYVGLGTLTPLLPVHLVGGEAHSTTTVNAATYSILATDYIIKSIYSPTNLSTVTLTTAGTIAGRVIIIDDAGGSAGINPITVDTQGAETIDGAASKSIASNYGTLWLYCDGTNWFTL